MDRKRFHIVHDEQPDRHVVYIKGELDLATAEQFQRAVEPLAHDASKPLVIRLEELSYIDSTGIGMFVALLKTRKKQEAPFMIENVPPKVKRLFDLTGVSYFFSEMDQTTERIGGQS
ncbi:MULTISPECIES: STAS domain-containing protein [Geobacillus]|uniref:Anti-sigma factor antagonist n=1 Tax=Geobacillus zalihae TaxID=213419 RepID=A0A7H1RSW5_9BACL|nr:MULTISPECIES: STAS domain-containing protein [Geobacillus]ALA70313.1 anti-sigma F factor antagonist [Geobacillus stearothermophilus 10]ADI28321.1 anti-sigma-factor antagonist [Geobacillus sp. C56-T3]ADU95861.1 anti-sigma-factor antagonist [Geobacillus sp. Y412MC52]AGE24010.1 anti-anti-SigB [Geobacillus sp. GHH01]EPR29994.1 Anti-sigma B factor antagonist [Geobacillus sp. WSUCF1]